MYGIIYLFILPDNESSSSGPEAGSVLVLSRLLSGVDPRVPPPEMSLDTKKRPPKIG